MISESLIPLHWDESQGGQPWVESLPPVPEEPLRQAERVVEAVAEVGQVLSQLNSSGYACCGFQPGILGRTAEGLRIRELENLAAPMGELPNDLVAAPAYAAPEVIEQSASGVGAATDVFHLAALFYALAARKCPEGTTRAGLSACRYRLPRFRIYDPTFPVGFEHVWQRGMHPNPNRRYASVGDFVGALREALAEVSVRSEGEEPLRLEVGARTEGGSVKSQLCPENQDAIYPDPAKGEESRLEESGQDILAVADGVSRCDHGSGDQASSIVIRWVKRAADQFFAHPKSKEADWQMGTVFNLLQQAVIQSTKEISQAVPSGPDVSPDRLMSSTLVAAIIKGHEVLVGNTGNSRAFLATPRYFEQINLDDDVWHARLRSGIPPEEVSSKKGNRSLRRVVGSCKLEEGKVVPDLGRLRFTGYRAFLAPGDILLLCSDGLIEPGAYLEPDETYAIIDGSRECAAQEICDQLVEAADRKQRPPSHGDNISAIIVKALPA